MTKIYKTASLIIVALLLPLSAHAQQVIQNRTYESGEQEQRNTSGSISTADNVLVKPAAKVDWESLTKIHLTPGFRAQPGANFHAVVPDPDAFVLVALDGDNQSAAPGEVNARPFDLAVWQHQAPVINMPVTLTVQSGGGSLMSSPTSGGVNSLTLISDSVGTVQAWFRQPVANNVTSVIRATSNGKILDLHSYNFETSLAYGNGNGNGSGGNGGTGGGDPNAPGNSNGNAPDWTKGKEGDNAAGFVVFSPEGDGTTAVAGGSGPQTPVLLTPKMTSNNAPAPYAVISSASWLTPPWQAFDGIKDATAMAHTNYGVTSNIDIGIDLVSARRVSKVKVYSRNGIGNPVLAQDTPKEIIIRSSADGINWKVEKTVGNIPAPTEDFAMIIDVDVDFTARFVGLILNNPTNNRGYTAISEIELYGYNDPTSTPAPASVLLTPAMTGNNAPAPYVVFESGNAGWPAWQAFNQNTTHWESANVFDSYGSGHAYIGIDLGSAKTLTKYTIRSRADQLAYQQFMRDFTVQGSNDGIIWTTLDTVVDYPQITSIGHVLQHSIGNTTAFRYYKIDVTKNYANPRVVIDEIGLYGY